LTITNIEIGHQDSLRFPIPSIGSIEVWRLAQVQFIGISSDDTHALTLQAVHRHHFAEGPSQAVVDLDGTVGFGWNGGAELLKLHPSILDQVLVQKQFRTFVAILRLVSVPKCEVIDEQVLTPCGPPSLSFTWRFLLHHSRHGAQAGTHHLHHAQESDRVS